MCLFDSEMNEILPESEMEIKEAISSACNSVLFK
jgi:hypothetical protein